MKINQMKKDEYFEGFYLIKRAKYVRHERERTTLPLPSRMILVRFQEIYGMLSLIMLKNLQLVR